MADCIFCKIVKGEIPCYKIYEDPHCIAFLDINQVSEGHTLVVSKDHYENFFDVKPDVLQKVVLSVQNVALGLRKALNLSGMNISTNNGTPGQEVPHVHFHLIPRFAGDNLVPWPSELMTADELKKMAERIRSRF